MPAAIPRRKMGAGCRAVRAGQAEQVGFLWSGTQPVILMAVAGWMDPVGPMAMPLAPLAALLDDLVERPSRCGRDRFDRVAETEEDLRERGTGHILKLGPQ